MMIPELRKPQEIRDVEADFAFGRIGELFTISFFTENNYLVTDVTSDKYYQSQDIDMLFSLPGRKGFTTVDSKIDSWYHTGNICFETISNRKYGTPGCYVKSTAKWWHYIFSYSYGKMDYHSHYFLYMPSVKSIFTEDFMKSQGYKFRPAGLTSDSGSEGYYVPIKDILEYSRAFRLRDPL